MARYFSRISFFLTLLLGVSLAQYVDPTSRAREDGGRFTGNPYEAEIRQLEAQVYEGEIDPEIVEDYKRLLYELGYEPRIYDENFETALPQTYEEGQWSFRTSPKVADFFGDEYIRVPLGLRYNFSDYFEMSFDLGTYFANPFEDEDDVGLYSLRAGAKYTWIDLADSGWNAAAGLQVDLPTSNAPLVLTDRYARHEPYISISRQFEALPDTLVYLNTTLQFVDESPFDTNPVDPRPRDRLFLRPGFVYYPGGHFRYGFELEYRTNAIHFRDKLSAANLPPVGPDSRLDNRVLASEEVHEITAIPGITWFPNQEFREGFFLPGNWDLGVRLEVPLVEETGENLGVSMRFRWFYDYRKFVLEDIPDRFSP